MAAAMPTAGSRPVAMAATASTVAKLAPCRMRVPSQERSASSAGVTTMRMGKGQIPR